MPDRFDPRIPVTLLTGALGSGKTTLLNRMLSEQHGLKFGVIVNEFGELSIDHHLVTATDEEVVELANGCICCSVREDLLDAVTAMLSRSDRIDYLVIETTGLADPRPVAQTFLHEDLNEEVRLDAIVTVIDAENFHSNLLNSSTTLDQVLAGDLLLLNKVDLVSDKMRQELVEEMEDINPAARILETVQAQVDLRLLLDVDLHQGKAGQEQAVEAAAQGDLVTFDQLVSSGRDGRSHLSREQIESLSFTSTRPFDYEKLGQFLESLPRNIFRGKGILWMEGYDDQLIFHLVGDRATAVVGKPWGEQVRDSKLVLIGKQLDRAALLTALEDCVL